MLVSQWFPLSEPLGEFMGNIFIKSVQCLLIILNCYIAPQMLLIKNNGNSLCQTIHDRHTHHDIHSWCWWWESRHSWAWRCGDVAEYLSWAKKPFYAANKFQCVKVRKCESVKQTCTKFSPLSPKYSSYPAGLPGVHRQEHPAGVLGGWDRL